MTPVGTSSLSSQRFVAMRRVLLVAFIVHLLLAVAKSGYGLFTGSLGLVADGLHSLLHALGTVIGAVGVTIAARPADPSHPYGYERYEPLAALGIVGLMFLAVREILSAAWQRSLAGEVPTVTPAGFVLLSVAMASNLGLAMWQQRSGTALQSEVLTTEGKRMIADVLVSLSAAAGLLGSALGAPVVDLLASLAIVAVILRAGWLRLRELSAILTDAAVVDLEPIARAARAVDGVQGVHRVRARGAAGRVRVDLHVTVEPTMSAAQAHELTHQVVRLVRAEVGGIVEVLVHVGTEPEPEHAEHEHF